MDVNSELKSKTPSSAEISKADFSKVFFESGAKTTHKLEVKDCPIERVTVYGDRAEVTRRVTFEATASGQHEIIVSHLCSLVVKDSVRVSGAPTTITVLEVVYEEKFESETQVQSASAAEIEAKEKQLKKLKSNLEQLQAKENRLNKEEAWLKAYSDKFVELDSPKGFSLEDAVKVMEFYRSEYDAIQKVRADLHKQKKELQEQIQLLTTEIERRKVPTSQSSEQLKPRPQVTITLFAHTKGQLSIAFSYLVLGAEWKPSYDIRIQTKTQTAQLFYYGTIINNTTEDWKEIRLSLSTATPSLDARPPPLYTLRVRFRPTYTPLRRNIKGKRKEARPVNVEQKKKASKSLAARSSVDTGEVDLSEDEEEEEGSSVGMMTADVEQSSTSQTYLIPRTCTIESDNKPHKVTVTGITLQTKFIYIAIPKLVQQAYLRARATNTSDYHLIPGPMSVFSDNFHVAKTELGTTPPGAEFDVFLGVDPDIKIEFRPVKTKEGKVGVVRKSKTETTSHKTIIHNNKQFPVTVHVFEQLPFSEESDKVKVKVIQPELKGNPKVTLNEFNNLRWTVTIQPQSKEVLAYEYQIEYPTDKELNIYEGSKVDTLE